VGLPPDRFPRHERQQGGRLPPACFLGRVPRARAMGRNCPRTRHLADRSRGKLPGPRGTQNRQPRQEDTMSENHPHDPSEHGPAARVKALEELLVSKGLIDPAALDAIVETYENQVGPRNGARVVAKAWVDPAFRKRLFHDAVAACTELGIAGPEGGHLVALENTPDVHNLVVCTLCSCYPWPVLGLPPAWYKSFAYRSRAVKDPRGVLRDFGVSIPDEVEVRVWDSSAEQRYVVIPERPKGSDKMSEEELAALVTRDSMIGVAKLDSSRQTRRK